MSSVPQITGPAPNMFEIRKAHPAIRKPAVDQSLSKPRQPLTPEEASELAEKGYRKCLGEGLPKEYAEQYRRETEEILKKPIEW